MKRTNPNTSIGKLRKQQTDGIIDNDAFTLWQNICINRGCVSSGSATPTPTPVPPPTTEPTDLSGLKLKQQTTNINGSGIIINSTWSKTVTQPSILYYSIFMDSLGGSTLGMGDTTYMTGVLNASTNWTSADILLICFTPNVELLSPKDISNNTTALTLFDFFNAYGTDLDDYVIMMSLTQPPLVVKMSGAKGSKILTFIHTMDATGYNSSSVCLVDDGLSVWVTNTIPTGVTKWYKIFNKSETNWPSGKKYGIALGCHRTFAAGATPDSAKLLFNSNLA